VSRSVEEFDIEGEALAAGSGMKVNVRVGVSSLSLAESPRAAGICSDHVRVLVEVFDRLPPILVNRRTSNVVDGMHRLHAARLRGEETIAAYWCDVAPEQEFALAVACNSVHGLALTLEERRDAARRMVVIYSYWSDRRISRIVGLSPSTVGNLRKRCSEAGQALARVGDDGRVRPVDPTARRELAAEILRENPGLSLRRVSEICGISPATVLDVRNCLSTADHMPPLAPSDRKTTVGAGGGRGRDAKVAGHTMSPDDALASLRQDPSIRFSQSGRVMLRLLEINLSGGQKYEQISMSLPDHCLETVGRVARAVAGYWTHFANQIEARRRRAAG
jgi:transposase